VHESPDAIEWVLPAMNARYRARRLPFEAPELALAWAPPDGGVVGSERDQRV
jgi:hypothetical protein